MKRVILECLAVAFVLAACICTGYILLLLALMVAAALCVRFANLQALADLCKKERPPALRTPNGPKKEVDPLLL